MSQLRFYILIGLISLIGLIDVGRKSLHFFADKQQIKNLNLQPMPKIKDNSMVKYSFVAQKNQIMEAFFSAVQRTGLQIQSSAIFARENLEIDVTLVGNFVQIQQLFIAMSRQCFPFLIKQAAMEKYAKQLQFRLNISFLKMCVTPTSYSKVLARLNDPFATDIAGGDENMLQNYPLKQIKQVGLLRYSNQTMAIIALPNGVSREIGMGDIVGRERAKWIGIQQHKMIFQLNGEEIQIG